MTAQQTDGRPLKPVRLQREDSLSALIAQLMDTVFVIPGTNIRFGLDALIGLFPGIGDSIGALISSVLIAQAARMGVPKIVLARMAGNVVINSLVGAVPIFGDVFSVFYRSNVKNYALLQKHAGLAHESHARDWMFVTALFLGMLALLAGSVIGLVALVHFLTPPR
jgi:hypothetical protein